MPEEANGKPFAEQAVPACADQALSTGAEPALALIAETVSSLAAEPAPSLGADAPAGEGFAPIAPEDAPAAIEALLFASGDPLTLEQLAHMLGLERTQVRRILDGLIDRYQRDRSRGILLREADGTFALSTKPAQRDVLARLFAPRNRPPLSAAAYETLAIIAYNQPVTRAQIEAVRGVNSDNVLQRLIDRSLVRETGTLEAPGRPALFATTEQFLLDFGLRSVADLPPMEMLMYGTLRDIEQALRDASNVRMDRQLTIEQLPGADRHENSRETVLDGSAGLIARAAEPLDAAAADEVLGMSAAIFGTPADSGSGLS